jgi:hypothetical protein
MVTFAFSIKKFDLLIFQQKNRIKYAKKFKLKNYVVFFT